MHIKRLILSNFKNIKSAELNFSPNINCIYGDNGEGKTNLLDAIYYLSMTKSFLQISDRFIYTYSESEGSLCGFYYLNHFEEKIAISVGKSIEKVVKRNGKRYSRISEHIGLLPIVVISPSDTSLIHDSGEERRRFMNVVLSQTDSKYLSSIQSYNRVLLQRNKLLKMESTPSDILLETFSGQLSRDGEYIYRCRKELTEELSALVSHFYEKLSGGKESVSLEYVSDLNRGDMSALLKESYNRDVLLKYTSVGIQRDDLNFLMDSRPIKKGGSQGQQKSFLISLKLAQLTLMKRRYGFSPILLLDDVFDKLDMRRVEYLIKMVSTEGLGQLFVTDSNKVRISDLVKKIDSESKFFTVVDGVFSEEL